MEHMTQLHVSAVLLGTDCPGSGTVGLEHRLDRLPGALETHVNEVTGHARGATDRPLAFRA